ncbi:PRA1 family protein 3-like [Phymastichus coffea]|uniref:PRA1 family protein 3-like n=1 Tax=Phymastichus coffea TaxID=108790 RepID=UPI00273B72B0|nr:PRA1 family protein 3-like [Phymastichus coffea]XP_058809584.1 PRA1 family protein 3-like [Phymastichus coffea]
MGYRSTRDVGDTDLELPPLRSINDFILESARFQIPNVKDLDKWGNRVVNNLLYYQTNYFFTSAVIFILVGLIHPMKMLVGMVVSGLTILAFAYISTEGRAVHNFKKKYPGAGILLMLMAGCILTYTLGSLLVFLLGILLPFSVIFVHASLRQRNLKNKVVNKIEGIGLKRSPMGIFLNQLDDLSGLALKAQTSFLQKVDQ